MIVRDELILTEVQHCMPEKYVFETKKINHHAIQAMNHNLQGKHKHGDTLVALRSKLQHKKIPFTTQQLFNSKVWRTNLRNITEDLRFIQSFSHVSPDVHAEAVHKNTKKEVNNNK